MSDYSTSTSTSTDISNVASSQLSAAPVADSSDSSTDEKGGLTADELKQFVMIPKDLVKKFDIGKVWEYSLSKKETFLVYNDKGNLVPVMALDCTYVGATRGAVGAERIDILLRRAYFDQEGKRDDQRGLANTIAANHLYHDQLKALMKKRGVVDPPSMQQRGDDESGGCDPQLRSDTVMRISMQDVGPDMDPKHVSVAALLGKGTLIALDTQDMCQWVLHKVVGVSVESLWGVVGELPINYAEMSPAQLATWLDEQTVLVEAVKQRKATMKAAWDQSLKRKHDTDTPVGVSNQLSVRSEPSGSDEAYEWEVASFDQREKIRLARIAAIETELAWLKAANPPTATTKPIESTESTEQTVSA